MFSKTATIKSTGSCWDNIKKAKKLIESADAVVIGAGAGLSTSAGFTYSGKRFEENFPDFTHLIRWKNIGHIGADTFLSIAIKMHLKMFMMIYTIW